MGDDTEELPTTPEWVLPGKICIVGGIRLGLAS